MQRKTLQIFCPTHSHTMVSYFVTKFSAVHQRQQNTQYAQGPFAGGEAQSLLPEPTHQERVKFNKIMEDVLGVENEEELPSTLSPHLAFLLSVDVPRLTNDLIRQALLLFVGEVMWAAAAAGGGKG